MEIIETRTLDAAVLDINLGNELSSPIAAVLEQRDVPFIFLTGYPRDGVFPSAVPRLKKPMQPERLREALADFARAVNQIPQPLRIEVDNAIRASRPRRG